MKKTFVDVDIYASRNMSKDKNIDYQFWFNKTIQEKLAASVAMIEISFNSSFILLIFCLSFFCQKRYSSQAMSIKIYLIILLIYAPSFCHL